MITSTHLLEAKKPNILKKNIVFFNYVNSDGLGDLGHLIDIAKPDTLNKSLPRNNSMGQELQLSPIYVITCNFASTNRLRFILNSLKENKMITDEGTPYDLNDDKQLADYINYIHKINPHVYLCTDDEERPAILKMKDVINNPTFQDQLIQAHAAFQVSLETKGFSSILQKLCIPCTYIREHITGSLTNIFFQGMGFSHRLSGIMLKRPTHVTLEDKAKALSSLQNIKYLHGLFDLKVEHPISIEQAKNFLETNLFIPGYFQSEKANSVFIHSLAGSPIANKFQNVVFHVNGSKFSSDSLSHEFLAKHGFKFITICSAENKPYTQEIKAATGNRELKIMTDFNLNNHDYNSLYNIGQLLAGCSGDKTLELVLSNGLIPLYEERPWKDGIAESFATLAEDYVTKPSIPAYINLFAEIAKYRNDVDDSMDIVSKIIALADDDFITQWQILITKLYEKHNFFDQLPIIFQKILCINDLIDCISSKKFADAKKIIAMLDTSQDIKKIIEWAIDNRMLELASFLYQNSQLDKTKWDYSYELTLNYLSNKYIFDSDTKIENQEKLIMIDFLNLIHNTIPTENSFFKSPPIAEAFFSEIKTIIHDEKQDENSKLKKISQLILENLATSELNPFISNIMDRIVDKDNLAIQIYLGLPKTIIKLRQPTLKHIATFNPEFFNAFISALKARSPHTIVSSKPSISG